MTKDTSKDLQTMNAVLKLHGWGWLGHKQIITNASKLLLGKTNNQELFI